jgi:membrane fusion protein, cation efflux system
VEAFCSTPQSFSKDTMKSLPLLSTLLAASLAISTPTLVFAHVGHGDEFQSQGGAQKVKINPETDQMLGILVTPIAAAADGGAAVMIPTSALVDADGKQLVFVQYENFYEPVPIKTGTTQGELVEVTEGLSVGEKLVTQGSLSLYAESRKTQTADATASSQPGTTHAQADAQGLPHSHDGAGNMAQLPGEATKQASGFPIGTLIAVGGGAVLLLGGAFAVMGNRKKGGL